MEYFFCMHIFLFTANDGRLGKNNRKYRKWLVLVLLGVPENLDNFFLSFRVALLLWVNDPFPQCPKPLRSIITDKYGRYLAKLTRHEDTVQAIIQVYFLHGSSISMENILQD